MIRPDLEQVPAYVPGKAVPGTLKIASNEMSQPPLPSVAAAIAETLAQPSTSPNRYPDMGAVALRTRIGENLGLPMEQVAVGCGSSALCLQLVQATSQAGDEVVFPWRSFEAYPILARIAGATPVAVPLDAQGRNDLDALAAAVTERTRLIFVCNPNNPTGTTVTREAFEKFMAAVPGNVVVALDEAYIELVDDDTRATTPLADQLVGTYPNLVGLRTFSKVYGLAGLRVGYMFGSKRLVEAVNKVAIPFSVNTVAQAAAIASLDAQAELAIRIKEVRDQRVRVTNAINSATGRDTVLPTSQANFVWIDESRIKDLSPLLADGSVDTTSDLGDYLAQRGILIRCFAGEGARITVTTDEEAGQLLAALGL
nr:histidinol-phosphate transaminase [Corynebacterium lactis]